MLAVYGTDIEASGHEGPDLGFSMHDEAEEGVYL